MWSGREQAEVVVVVVVVVVEQLGWPIKFKSLLTNLGTQLEWLPTLLTAIC